MVDQKVALEKTLEYFGGDELAATTWIKKYALRDKEGNLLEETPTDMHWRLANEFARIEAKYKNPLSAQEIFDLFDRFKYVVPQGRPMAGIGNKNQKVSISNCFASGYVEDNYQSIMRHDSYIANIGKRGGGMGVNISTLRPSGSSTSNSALGIAGATQFMDRFSYTTGEVTQGNRRGALMVILEVNHPDIRRFVTKKLDKVSVTNANISIALTDEFMVAVKNNTEYPLTFGGKVYENVKAKEIYDLIVKSAKESAEPGVLFWDTVRTSPADMYKEFQTEGTNPCKPHCTLHQ